MLNLCFDKIGIISRKSKSEQTESQLSFTYHVNAGDNDVNDVNDHQTGIKRKLNTLIESSSANIVLTNDEPSCKRRRISNICNQLQLADKLV